jgi:hypothetical protein
MPTRKAILISYPGELGQENYCKGVNKDIQEYLALLKSPFGGAWSSKEISFLHKPDVDGVRKAVGSLSDIDYALVIFSGHGKHSANDNSFLLQLNKSEFLDSKELKNGSKKQTIILDCCRKVEEVLLVEDPIFTGIARLRSTLHETECRKYFDKRIEECPEGLIVLRSCSKYETSGDDAEKGGYYTHNLIRCVEEWAEHNNVDVSKSYDILSITSAHERACPRVHDSSGGRQNPQIERPKTKKHFPFAVVA